ncbi:uncharacterized protein DUF4906 [Dysgonomonas alginatilytica]|uniref:Uncharacterized protein DUF4906 n=1 Tax=Dysgonomonas alginatilytica TaxID=1605892 RepID=A0A2V3PT54_9BACT|nr:BACON domain-containing protein [Dysgonomonas alginatilytica]PXV66345.1 uncharacterized protein DUF4906 [Dysgonomonas alginatilytica]
MNITHALIVVYKMLTYNRHSKGASVPCEQLLYYSDRIKILCGKFKVINHLSINKMKVIPYTLFFIFMLASCQQEETLNTGKIVEGKEIKASFTIQYSNFSIPKLRSQTSGEKEINDIEIVVFVSGAYQYTVTGKNLTTSSGNVEFNALLYSTASPVTLFILANGTDILANNPPLEVGDTESEVAVKLKNTFSAAGINGNFPMFASYSLPSGLDALIANNITGINFLRSIARIDVNANAVTSNFRLASVQAFRANNSLQIIPQSRESNSATVPSIPSGSTANINTTVITPTTTEASSLSQLYLPESAAPSEADQVSQATCVVIGGYYNGSSTISYYRMDFDSGISGHPFGQILRNYQYTFNIESVSLVGYPTAEAAATNPSSSGISSSIIVWDSNTTNMVTDGQYYLGISKNPIFLASGIGSTNTSLIDANTTYTMQWASSEGIGTGTPSTSLNNGIFSVEQINGGTSIQVTALTANSLTTDIVQYILLRSNDNNSLSLFITIRQTAFGVIPSSITISASGGEGYALVTSSSPWGSISNQSWFTANASVGDTLKWTATQNTGSTLRTGNLVVNNLNGEQASIPFQQNIPNNTVLNVYSLRSGLAYLGLGSAVNTAESRAQGLKGILTNAANFSLSGKVNCGGFNFTQSTVLPHALNATVLANINILYINLVGGISEISTAGAAASVTWLEEDPKRVMIVAFDLSANTNIMNALGVTNITYYGDVAGTYPMQFNSNTTYFSNTGPFTSYPGSPIKNPFSFRNYDANYAELSIAAYPSITPILKGPHGNCLLGVDYSRRVIYVGDIDIFSSGSGYNATPNNYIQNITGLINSDASRLIGNVWGWATNTALGVTP